MMRKYSLIFIAVFSCLYGFDIQNVRADQGEKTNNTNMVSESTLTGNGNKAYRDDATEYLFQSLKALSRTEFSLFGVPNALTISFNGGPIHPYGDSSDCKDITGSHPAFIESDFEWYIHPEYKPKWDIEAMKEAYKKGIVLGYCYHLRGLKSKKFSNLKDNKLTADSTLVHDILSNPDRKTNSSLEWYLHRLDSLVIPTFKELGFPIIYRPFHEMTGNWFWWGSTNCTAQEYIAIYRLTVDYFRKNGLRNILYAWAPDKTADMSRYPGDDYIDVIGYDGYDVGIVDYHTKKSFISNVAYLSDYAMKHNKIAAVTEVGTNSLLENPQFWTDNVFTPLKADSIAKHVAWVMTWYSADWGHNQKGINYIPYSGIENKKNGQTAIDDFIKFYNDPRTIFQADMPNFYLNTDSSVFIYPVSFILTEGQSLELIGGMKCNWFLQKPVWKSANEKVATISKNGVVKALKAGSVEIIATSANGKTSKSTLNVVSR
jgi:mannan endo-1,4-beta-mannosidase